jgi:hypothetical protein
MSSALLLHDHFNLSLFSKGEFRKRMVLFGVLENIAITLYDISEEHLIPTNEHRPGRSCQNSNSKWPWPSVEPQSVDIWRKTRLENGLLDQ